MNIERINNPFRWEELERHSTEESFSFFMGKEGSGQMGMSTTFDLDNEDGFECAYRCLLLALYALAKELDTDLMTLILPTIVEIEGIDKFLDFIEELTEVIKTSEDDPESNEEYGEYQWSGEESQGNKPDHEEGPRHGQDD